MKKRTSMSMMMVISHDFPSVLFFIVIVSFFNLSSSQPNPPPPRNIETFYPFAYSPPPQPDGSAPSPSPPPPPPSPSSSATSRKAIMTAVGATAASTLVLAAVFFLIFMLISRSRRKENTNGGSSRAPPLPPAVAPSGSRSEYRKLGGNVKGYIIDEDGLDMLYWKKFSNSGGGFRKEPYNTPAANGKRPPAVPRGRSSSSHAQIHVAQQPVISTMAVPKAPPPPVPVKKVAPPPPPPPFPGKKNQAAPPPLPSSKPPAVLPSKGAEDGADCDQVKLKPLHWEKLNINPDHSMVWGKLEKGSFQYNGDMMEALFGVVATNRRSPKKPDSAGEASNSNPQIFILEPRKSQNIAIVIKSLGIPLDQIIYALIQGKGLTADTLEKLTRAALTREEASQILAFNGDTANLAYAESFLYALLKAVPSAFARVDDMLFRSSYDSEIFGLKESLRTLDSACNELRSRGIFLKLLEAILKAGNRLNAGTSRGDAKAFNLTTLRKLSDYKSSDGKTTLLHFVVHEVVRNEGRRCVMARSNSISRSSSSSASSLGPQLDDPTTKGEREREFLKLGLPVVGGLSSEFSNVKKAASIDYDALTGTLASLAAKVEEARQMICNGETSDGSDGFFMEAREFFKSAEVEIKDVEEEHTRIMNLVNKTTQYYQAGVSNEKTPLQLFVIVKDFLGMVDQTCVEITRSSQQKKQAPTDAAAGSGASQPDVLRSRVTFPKLPEHFLSDKSSSGSDEDS